MRKYVIVIGTVLWSAVTWLTAFVGSFPQLLMARASMSFAEGCFNPSAYALLTDTAPKRNQGMVLGLMSLTYPVGTAAALILASAIGMNKTVSKQVFRSRGLLVGPYEVIYDGDAARAGAVIEQLQFPVVVKPHAEGSSVGVSLVFRKEEVAQALALAFEYGNEILIEKFIKGREVQVGILGDRALGAIEIVPKRAFYDYKAKYEKGMSDHFFPARIPAAVYEQTLEAGLAAHRAIGCRGYSRVDFIIDEAGAPYILEVNTLPGMTATSLLPDIAKGVGISFPDLVEEILRLAVTD